MKITETKLRATIRHSIRKSLNENAAKVAEVYADCVYTGCTLDDLAQEMRHRVGIDDIIEFLRTRKSPRVIKTFEDALAMTGEFDVKPADAWLSAWQAAAYATGDAEKMIAGQ